MNDTALEKSILAEQVLLIGADGIDGTAASYQRNFEVYWKKEYDNDVLNHPILDGALIAIGLGLGVLSVIIEYRRRRQEKMRSSEAYLISRLQGLNSEFNPESWTDELNELADAIFKDNPFKVNVSQNDSSKKGTPEYNIKLSVNDGLELNALEYDLSGMQKFFTNKLYQNSAYNAAGIVGFMFLNYSMFYWIGYWITMCLGSVIALAALHTALGIGLSFGLPLILPLAVMVAKFVIYKRQLSKTKDNPTNLTEAQANELSEARRNLMLTAYAKGYYDKHESQFARDVSKLLGYDVVSVATEKSVKSTDVANAVATDDKAEATASKELPSEARRKHLGKAVLATAIISGLVMGFIFVFFATWPVSSFLAAVFASVNAATPIIYPVTIALAGVFGVWFGFKKSIDASIENTKVEQQAKHKAELLSEMQMLREDNKTLRGNIKKLQASLREKGHITADRNLFPTELDCDRSADERFWRTLEPKASKWVAAKKVLNRVRTFIFGAPTGSLIVRALFATSATTALIFAPVSLTTFAILGSSFALVWATYRVAEHMIQRRNKTSVALIKEAEARLYGLKRENALLNMYKNAFEHKLGLSDKPDIQSEPKVESTESLQVDMATSPPTDSREVPLAPLAANMRQFRQPSAANSVSSNESPSSEESESESEFSADSASLAAARN